MQNPGAIAFVFSGLYGPVYFMFLNHHMSSDHFKKEYLPEPRTRSYWHRIIWLIVLPALYFLVVFFILWNVPFREDPYRIVAQFVGIGLLCLPIITCQQLSYRKRKPPHMVKENIEPTDISDNSWTELAGFTILGAALGGLVEYVLYKQLI